MSTAPQHHLVPEPIAHAMQAAMGVWLVATLRAAIECNLADESVAGARPIDEIARRNN